MIERCPDLLPIAAAVEVLEPPLRLTLWKRVFDRFLGAVWIAIVVLVSSGVAMLWRFGGAMPMHVHLMIALGVAMIAVFINVYFVSFPALRRAVAEQNWPAGGEALGRIRQRVGFNIILGVLTIAAATLGRWL